MSESAIAVFSDIHSNLEALEAVLADMDALGVQRRVCLGDIVGYAANPGKCLKLVRSLGCPVLKGNHDAFAASDDAMDDMRDVAEIGIKFARQKLTVEELEYLGGLPLTMVDGDCEFVHASLHRPEDWTYLVRREALRENFKAQMRRLCFGGHTHVPGVWHLSRSGELRSLGKQGRIDLPTDGKILINAGSVGQPRDLCRDACYAIYDPSLNSIEFRRIAYDVSKTKRKITRAKLPPFSAQRLSLGR
jgi:diadenosine tetraphosphatase ApaH/serine/threonine PP2A family protein phosphatase